MSRDAQPSSAVPPVPRRYHVWRRRLFLLAGSLLGLFLLVVFLLPMWASTERGRAFVLKQVNQNLAGTLDCTKWRLSWFRGIRIEGLRLTTPSGKCVLACRELTTEMTFGDYLWGTYSLGNTRVLEPRLDLDRNAEGRNDLAPIFAHTKSPLPWTSLRHSLSGLIQIDRGELILSAAGSAEPLHLQNISAEIPIASPQAHIHFAVYSAAAATPETLTAEGNLPPLETWPANPLALTQDLELHAGNLPLPALACWLGANPQWAQSIGPTLTTLAFISRPSGPVATAELVAYGATGSLEAKVLLEPRGNHLLLLIPERDYYARINGRMSPAAAAWLKYVNPLFSQTSPGAGTVTLTLANARLDLQDPRSAIASGQLFCDHLRLKPGGFLAAVLKLSATGSARLPGASPLPVFIPPLRWALAAEQISCPNFTLKLPRSGTLNFSGTSDLNGQLHLRLNLKLEDFGNPATGLNAGTLDIPISGTVDAPHLDLPG